MIVLDPVSGFLLVFAGIVIGTLLGYAAGREVGYEVGWKHAVRAVDEKRRLTKTPQERD